MSGSTSFDAPTRRNVIDGLVLFGLFAAALALRLYHLGFQSFWLDEAYTWERAIKPLGETISASIARHHVPTYFVFMHYWIALGDDEFILRLPSAIFGALTVSATHVLGTVLGNRRVGLVAALCVLLSPLQVHYSQEARMYTMMTFTVTVCLTALAWLGTHLEAASIPILGTGRLSRRSESSQATPPRSARLAWVAYVVGLLGTLYLHNTGVFLGATAVLAFSSLLVGARGRRLPFTLNFLAANAVVVAVWALYLGTAISQAEKVSHEFWADFPTPAKAGDVAADLYAFSTRAPYGWYLLGAISAAGVFALRRTPHVAAASLVCALGAPAVDYAVSFHTPMFMPRLMLWATVPGSVLVALGANSVRHWLGPLAVALFAMHLAQPGLHTILETKHKPMWRETAIVIAQRAGPGSLVLPAQRQAEVLMRYYFERKKLPIAALPVQSIPLSRLKRAMRHETDVWVVDSLRQGKAPEYVAALRELGGQTIFKRKFGNKIKIHRVQLNPRDRRP